MASSSRHVVHGSAIAFLNAFCFHLHVCHVQVHGDQVKSSGVLACEAVSAMMHLARDGPGTAMRCQTLPVVDVLLFGSNALEGAVDPTHPLRLGVTVSSASTACVRPIGLQPFYEGQHSH